MPLWRRVSCFSAFLATFLISAFITSSSFGQQPATARKTLTVERIYSQPGLSGRLTRGLAWTPDGKGLSYFETKGSGKDAKAELWLMDATSGERRLLVAADKLESILPADTLRPTQATGLGRRAPSQYQWAPDGAGILFQGPTALAWLDLKTQTGRTLVSGKATLADPKISPDGRSLSFVRDHNVWLVNLADGKERAVTLGGTEEIHKGELDWVYPEELDIKTAYWWAPDSSAIAYLEMDERKVSQYPLVDFSSPSGEAEMERYPTAGGANPIVRVFVASLNGGEPRAIDIGAETDIYVPRVNWLTDSKHLAIQRLNRPQTILDLLIADAGTGKTRTVLTESDPNWINVSDDLYFLKDGKRFLWSSERSGYRHLYLFDLERKQLTQLTKGEWEVTSLDGVDEAKGLVYFTATEKSLLERHLYRVALDGTAFTSITKEAGTHAAIFSPNASAFYDTYSNTAAPQRQDLYRADGSRIAAINENRVAELADYHFSPMEFLTVQSHDGVALNASIIKPRDFSPQKKYPVLVYTYGGPHAQVVRNGWGGANFLWHQLMAQKGYIIFSLDNRGSAGRGHAFETSLHFRMGAQELSDQRDGVRYLKSLPYVDANRIGIWGWSYGGHMTLHAMFEAGDDFKAGFAGGPVTDWRYYDSIYTERYLGLPQKNGKGYQDSSPVKYAAQLKGKLLIAHGTGDDNVHFANTLAVINDLIEAGKYVEILPFPGRGHGVSDPPARRVLMQRVTQFFLDNL
ncbi:MAG: S9 family peptidase [Acidobacteria bacterium]|nr:MAG: S9 family peptidase [Acidobacteriota bacterium]PYT41825.1 MAG: S9 family peptidase [Acidobacteriota bacterium]